MSVIKLWEVPLRGILSRSIQVLLRKEEKRSSFEVFLNFLIQGKFIAAFPVVLATLETLMKTRLLQGQLVLVLCQLHLLRPMVLKTGSHTSTGNDRWQLGWCKLRRPLKAAETKCLCPVAPISLLQQQLLVLGMHGKLLYYFLEKLAHILLSFFMLSDITASEE